MGRDNSCPTGMTRYKKKEQVPGLAFRCDRCRGWHEAVTRKQKKGARR